MLIHSVGNPVVSRPRAFRITMPPHELRLVVTTEDYDEARTFTEMFSASARKRRSAPKAGE
jgi:hypothetical protein